MNPFEIINDVTYNKKGIITEDNEKEYVPFIVNKGLSYFIDTTFQANEMNYNHHVDHVLQFDYLLNSIRQKKRYSKWLKPEKLHDLDVVKEYYGFSNGKAKDALSVLTKDQLAFIKDKLNQGGAEK